MRLFFISLLLTGNLLTNAQGPVIRTDRINIVRDSFGVPHIFAPTDPEVAYGLAWAHAEDDFATIQTLMLTAKGKLGTHLGKQGATVDYVFGLLNTRATVDSQITHLKPEFLDLLKGYLMGLEAYAKAHPKEVLNKHVFPVTVNEYLAAATFSVAIFTGIDRVLPTILNNTAAQLPGFNGEGSNAFAIHSGKSATGENMLVINAHQPIEGATAFYEAHLQSEEGWNIIGGLFPGAPMVFHGVNEHLAWAHTVNNQDKIDLYQLQTDKQHPGQYKVDGEWLPLEKRRLNLKVKGVPVTVHRTVYKSIYGPTIKTSNGSYYALRVPALMDAAALQQWYAMNKAKSFSEFYAALQQHHLPMFNIMYADKRDTIFYISNGKIPVRNPDTSYHWQSVLPGNTRKTLWTEIKPLSQLPQYLNPKGGYLFNTNHSPFQAAAAADNLQPAQYDRNDGYELFNNNRSRRARDLIEALDKISYDDIKRIKFDAQYPNPIIFSFGYFADTLFMVDEKKHAALAPLITALKTWDRKATIDSKGAAVFFLAFVVVPQQIMKGRGYDTMTMPEAVATFQAINDYMMKNFGTTDLTLGDLQKLVRGDQSWPIDGMPDLLRAVYTTAWKDGRRKMAVGDAYIAFVRFPKDGSLPFIESVNTFGASSHRASKHYADQIPMFRHHQLKVMSLSKEEVMKRAFRIYGLP